MQNIDNKTRCFGSQSQLYANYHDHEWGRPVHDDQRLFEMLILEGAQAGLSWETVLKKREGYRKAFHNFDIQKVANMSDSELEALRENDQIIRNRLKIYAARTNAQAAISVQNEFGSLSNFLWAFVGNKPIKNSWQTLKDVPIKTPESDALAKALKKQGMKFVGTTIMYAFMQAVGMVNDHISTCWCRSSQ